MESLRKELYNKLKPGINKHPSIHPKLYDDLFKAADGFLKKQTKISVLRAAVKAIKNN